ncbi:MAG: hypothetical protein HN572_02685, partial [Kordiimonadaceae bacterium]|nr:hypothetical protein [Kordiimonadaceae bacterium]
MHKFQYILLPVLGIIFVTFASFFLMLEYMASDTDEAMLNSEANMLRAQIKQSAVNISSTAEDNSVWNAAYDNIFTNFNEEWLINNYGENVQFLSNINIFLVYGVNNNVLYSSSEMGQPSPAKLLASGLGSYLSTLTVDDNITTVKPTGIIEVDQRLYIFGASLIQRSDNPDTTKITPERRPAVIFFHELNETSLSIIEENLSLDNLQLRIDDENPGNFLNIDQSVSKNIFMTSDTIYFQWNAKTPGADFRHQLLTPLIIVISLVTLAFLYFYKSASNMFT